MVPTILLPKLLSLKNRWRYAARARTQYVRDAIILVFSFSVMYGLFRGCLETLNRMHEASGVAFIPVSLPLGLVFLLLAVMLLFSNSVSALGSLFLSHDLDLILAAPVTPFGFFTGKLLEVLVSSSWMALVFGVPIIVACGASYHAGPSYYLMALLALIPYFTTASAIAVMIVSVFALIIPANRTREIFLAICAMALLGVYLVAKLIIQTSSTARSLNDLLRLVNVLAMPNQSWMPSYWVSICLGESLEPSGRPVVPFITMLYAVALGISSLAYLSFRNWHYAAYSRSKSVRHGLTINSKRSQARFSAVTPFLAPPYRALVAKEYKMFARDMTQAVQLLLLLGLCMIYLYNFKILSSVEGLPEATRTWWQGFLVLSNLSMGAFVITAVGTRFVFPSISLEGQAYWILQSSPLPTMEILRAKFWAWFIPVGAIAAVVFASGALAINAEPHVVLLSALTSWFICYGIVGMAVGLGAYFANFTWEHASQLAASFGSLVYMLTSTILIALNMLPISLLIFLRTLRNFHYRFSDFEWYVGVTSASLLLLYINYAATRWSLRMGAQALDERMR